jgi:serine-protein kinase ATM
MFASLHTLHVPPVDIVNLLRACCGATGISLRCPEPVSGGPISQAWKAQWEIEPINRYLLLLENSDSESSIAASNRAELGETVSASDSAAFHASKKLILELLYPRLEELQELCVTWANRGTEGNGPVSPDRFQSLFSACIVSVLLTPQLVDLNSRQSRDIEVVIFKIVDDSMAIVLDTNDNQVFFDIILKCIRSYIPAMTTNSLAQFIKEHSYLLRLLGTVAGTMHERNTRQSSGQNQDFMDLDDEFDSQASKTSSASRQIDLPRQDIPLSLFSTAFYQDTIFRLYFMEVLSKDPSGAGLMPPAFIDRLILLSNEEFLSCRALLTELSGSDLTLDPEDATKILEKLGGIVSDTGYECCEVALCLSLDILRGLVQIWCDSKHEVADMAVDLYEYFINTAWENNRLSPTAQIALAKLLFCLLQWNPQYGTAAGLSSCRTSLLSILQKAPIFVKYYIAINAGDIFSYCVLKIHDDIFIDVLDSLPTDPDVLEGIAIRVFALSELACRWPTLLRRCTYHIFETPGIIVESTKYATRCLEKVSITLKLKSPQELFCLFAPQLLYTWLDKNSIDNIPYEIFGFEELVNLLSDAQAETSALLIMRGQDTEIQNLANKLGQSLVTIIKDGFAKIMAYCFAHDMSITDSENSGESRVKKRLGREPYLDCIYVNFVDVVALFFDLVDQEDPIEKYFAKDENFLYAASIMQEIKKFSHSAVGLPPNQQPMFKAKYLLRELFYLCSRTEYELPTLWTPALVVSVARKLINTVHPALGSLHACSVLRKVRILICLAGPVALDGYPLEMLLHSIRSFIVDSECADDAIGMSQYLLSNGSSHLAQAPSFLAGYALSTLASLRVFLESSQSSTTQESQFKATMSKAQQFHAWFSRYLAEYESPAFKHDPQRTAAFRSITLAASHIRSSGNADRGTHESSLLLEILQDEDRDDKLLSDSSRDLALGMLCGDFQIPASSRLDIIETDEAALAYGGVVWKSCRAQALSDEYLAWAGRVIGKSFAASGDIQQELLRESSIAEYSKIAPESNGSVQGLLQLLQRLTLHKDSPTAGLAESALRAITSDAEAAQAENENGNRNEADNLLVACQKTLSETLFLASEWTPYRTPPSDNLVTAPATGVNVFLKEQIESSEWLQHLAIYLSQAAPSSIILSVLDSILTSVKGFAEKAFPFIVHIALESQIERQQSIKRHLSDATREWLSVRTKPARDNIKLLINTILYLRTQALPNEASIADRSHWLDIDLSLAANGAIYCGMHKTALLFLEMRSADPSKTSRRSSVSRDIDSTESLLAIFENIDDPDAYYGLPQTSNLTTVLARLEYEKDGGKTLAFRGAQYDSHLRRRDTAAQSDVQSLVNALTTVGLSGLSHSLLQTQQANDGTNSSLESTFQTARRLEIWNLPAPAASHNHAVTIYKAFQSIHQATDVKAVRVALYDGLSQTMRNLVNQGFNPSSLRKHLGSMAILSEIDDILNVSDSSELEAILPKFENRSTWMRRGRYVYQGHFRSVISACINKENSDMVMSVRYCLAERQHSVS